MQQFRKELDASLASYEQALALFRQVGDRLGEANVYLERGNVYLVQQDVDEALTWWERAADL